MAVWGQDVTQVRALAKQLSAKATEIQNIMQQLTSQLQNVQWSGPDAEKFRGDWQGQHMAQLKQVVNALNEASQRANRNAQQQETTSQQS